MVILALLWPIFPFPYLIVSEPNFELNLAIGELQADDYKCRDQTSPCDSSALLISRSILNNDDAAIRNLLLRAKGRLTQFPERP